MERLFLIVGFCIIIISNIPQFIEMCRAILAGDHARNQTIPRDPFALANLL